VSAAQQKAMKDGVVTQDEYAAGYRRYVACLADAGYTVLENGLKSTLYDYSVPAGAVDSGADAKCYNSEFKQIDVAWQIANPPRTAVSDMLAKCLADAGLDTQGNEDQLNTRMVKAGLDPQACIEAQSK